MDIIAIAKEATGLIDKAYQEGFDRGNENAELAEKRAWETAISILETDDKDLVEIFGTSYVARILSENKPLEALEKLKTWQVWGKDRRVRT